MRLEKVKFCSYDLQNLSPSRRRIDESDEFEFELNIRIWRYVRLVLQAESTKINVSKTKMTRYDISYSNRDSVVRFDVISFLYFVRKELRTTIHAFRVIPHAQRKDKSMVHPLRESKYVLIYLIRVGLRGVFFEQEEGRPRQRQLKRNLYQYKL